MLCCSMQRRIVNQESEVGGDFHLWLKQLLTNYKRVINFPINVYCHFQANSCNDISTFGNFFPHQWYTQPLMSRNAPPHKRLLNRDLHSFPIVLLANQINQSPMKASGHYKISHDLPEAWCLNTSIFPWYGIFWWLKHRKIINCKYKCFLLVCQVICWKGKNCGEKMQQLFALPWSNWCKNISGSQHGIWIVCLQ